ncbi:hypothetical protein LDFHOB_09065 [Candidatus Electronema aureum]
MAMVQVKGATESFLLPSLVKKGKGYSLTDRLYWCYFTGKLAKLSIPITGTNYA